MRRGGTWLYRGPGGRARVDDFRVRSLRAAQLNDELGNGDFSRIHRVLFNQLIDGISPWRPRDFTDALRQPGRRLATRQTARQLDIAEDVVVAIEGQLDIEEATRRTRLALLYQTAGFFKKEWDRG